MNDEENENKIKDIKKVIDTSYNNDISSTGQVVKPISKINDMSIYKWNSQSSQNIYNTSYVKYDNQSLTDSNNTSYIKYDNQSLPNSSTNTYMKYDNIQSLPECSNTPYIKYDNIQSVPNSNSAQYIKYDSSQSVIPNSSNTQYIKYDNHHQPIQYPVLPNIVSSISPNIQQIRNFNESYMGGSHYRYLQSFDYGQNYGNGCTNYNYIKPIRGIGSQHLDNRSIKTCPSLQPTLNTVVGGVYHDLLMEHNYAKPILDNINKGELKLEEIVSKKRSLNEINKLDRNKLETSSCNVVNKKKKNASNREMLMIPISKGFIREMVKVPIAPVAVGGVVGSSEEFRKCIIYRTPEGMVLNKKADVKNYLNSHKIEELKAEMFSFDSRLCLTPKKARENNGKKSLIGESSLNNDISNRRVKDNNMIGNNSGTKKQLSSRCKKIVSKYFKKSSEDLKYLDGINNGSYRRKLPILTKSNIKISIDNTFDSIEVNNIYSDGLCVYEFIKNFGKNLKINIINENDIDLYKLISSIEIKELSCDNLYINLLTSLLKYLIINDNFTNDIHTLYFIDNIYSIEWNWLLVNELLCTYIRIKSVPILQLDIYKESIYIKNLNELMNEINIHDSSIYCFKASLKIFILRFLVDQISWSCSFATCINDIVENVCKNRRDKFHIDTQIRQLKNNKNNDEKLNEYESNRDILKNDIKSLNSSLRSLFLGQDRFSREYTYSSTLNTILIEGVGNFESLIENKLLNNRNIFKKPFIISDNNDDNNNNLVELNSNILQYITISDNFTVKYDLNQKLNELTSTTTTIDSDDENIIDSDNILKMLCECPKIIRCVTEDEFDLFVDYFNANLTKQNKKTVSTSEYNDGWWYINDYTKLLEFSRTLNSKGIREHNLIRSITKHQDELIEMNEQNNNDNIMINYTFNYNSSNNISLSDIYQQCLILIKNEIIQISHKMDKYLNKLGIQIDKSHYDYCLELFSTCTLGNNSVGGDKCNKVDEGSKIDGGNDKQCRVDDKEGQVDDKQGRDDDKQCRVDDKQGRDDDKEAIIDNGEEIKNKIKLLINYFSQGFERKFDRPWLSKWNESFELNKMSSLSKIYIHCLSLKLKIDPNCKICQICNNSNDIYNISECYICSKIVHDECLIKNNNTSMKKYKKNKLICEICYKDTIEKSIKICHNCNIKSGKTIICSICNEYYHYKCMASKSKKKNSQFICNNCSLLNKINHPKIYIRPTITFSSDIIFEKYSNICLQLLKLLKDHKDSLPFHIPVDDSIPSYYDIIKKPMDLSTIELKINNNQYQYIIEFYDDIIQIFENCHIFNEDHSKIAKCGVRLQKLFEREWIKTVANFKLE